MALPFSSRISEVYALTAGQTGPFTPSPAWPLYAAADLLVLRRRDGVVEELELGVDYTITGAGIDSSGFSLTLLTGAEEDDELLLAGARDVARITTYTSERGTTPSFLNLDLNIVYSQLQEMQREVARAFKSDRFDPTFFDVENRRLRNVGTALAPTDAVNLGQIQDAFDAETAVAIAAKLAAEAAQAEAEGARDAAVAEAGAALIAQVAAEVARDAAQAYASSLPQINVLHYCLPGTVPSILDRTNTTNLTTYIQAAETARSAVGGELIFPAGDYLAQSITINRAAGGAWHGISGARIRAWDNNAVLLDVSGAAIGSTAPEFSVSGIHFHNNGKTGVCAYQEASAYFTTIRACNFTNLAWCAKFNRGRHIAILNNKQFGTGQWSFSGVGTGVGDRIFDVTVSDHHLGSAGGNTWATADALFYIYRAVNTAFNNVVTSSLDGTGIGIKIEGACEGVFVNNSVIVYPSTGVLAQVGADGVYPGYVYLTNTAVDQPKVTSIDLDAAVIRLTNVNATFGHDRTNTGAGIRIRANSFDVDLHGVRISHMEKAGLVIDPGAKDVRISSLYAKDNNLGGGGFPDVDLGSCSFTDVALTGRNIIGANGVTATGQRVVDGVTSPQVFRDLVAASTTATTSAETLLTYTVPANALKVGQRVRVRAWGTTAANGNTKTGRLWFSSGNLGGFSGALNAVTWSIEADIWITGSNNQEYLRESRSAGGVQAVRGDLTQSLASSFAIMFQGQNGTASAGDITCEGLTVEILD